MTSRPAALRFTVDSQLMSELGERLVTRNHIAFAELVKNAYDADATKLSIEFCDYEDDDSGQTLSAIVLIDDGHDMRFTDVEAFWMRSGQSVDSQHLKQMFTMRIFHHHRREVLKILGIDITSPRPVNFEVAESYAGEIEWDPASNGPTYKTSKNLLLPLRYNEDLIT